MQTTAQKQQAEQEQAQAIREAVAEAMKIFRQSPAGQWLANKMLAEESEQKQFEEFAGQAQKYSERLHRAALKVHSDALSRREHLSYDECIKKAKEQGV